MDVKPWQVWLRVGVGVLGAGLVCAFMFGLVAEAVLTIVTVAVCALSLIPLLVDRRARRHLDEHCAGAPDRTGNGRHVA